MNKILPFVAAIILIFTIFYIAKTILRNNNKESDTIQNELSEESQDHAQRTQKKSDNDFLDILKYIHQFSNDITQNKIKTATTIPSGMDEVEMTTEVQEILERFPNGYNKMDYRIKLTDRIRTCLGIEAPKSGQIIGFIMFDLDQETQIATGSQERPFRLRETHFDDPEEESLVIECIVQSHVGFSYDATGTLTGPIANTATNFIHPLSITFPIENDELYKYMKKQKH